MAIRPNSNSRFRESTPILTRNGEETFGIMTKFRFMDRNNLDEGQILTRVTPSAVVGRPDLMAEMIYGDASLHWILIFFNRVENPFGWPKNQQVIEFPSPTVVNAEI